MWVPFSPSLTPHVIVYREDVVTVSVTTSFLFYKLFLLACTNVPEVDSARICFITLCLPKICSAFSHCFCHCCIPSLLSFIIASILPSSFAANVTTTVARKMSIKTVTLTVFSFISLLTHMTTHWTK